MSRILFIVFLIFITTPLAVLSKEPVTIIYVHGFNAADKQIVLDEARNVSNAFAGKTMGPYVFSGKHKVVFWADLFDCDKAYKIYRSGLLSINTDNNFSKRKNTTKFENSLFNPCHSFVHPKDKGSGACSVFFRNAINDFLYQIFCIKDSYEKQNIVIERIQNTADSLCEKYIIIGHSFGAVAAVDFIERKVIGNDKNTQKFVGLITSADLNTTFHANIWDKTLKEDNPKNIAKFIIENNKFWICYNHRNDIVATNLPSQLLNIKAKGNGFIISKTTKSIYTNPYSAMLRPFSMENGKVRAHSWLHLRPDDFAKKVIAAYNEKSSIQ